MSQDSSTLPTFDDQSSPEPVSHHDNHNPNHYLGVQNESATATTSCEPTFPTRSNRPSRACTIRAVERLLMVQSVVERKPKARKEQRNDQNEESPPHFKQTSPESDHKTEILEKPEPFANGKCIDSENFTFSAFSPDSLEFDGTEEDEKMEDLDRGNRRRQRPRRYSEKEFVEAVSDKEADCDSDDDIFGEAIYDEEYLRQRRQRKKTSSSSEGDEEYHYEEEDREEEDEDEDSSSDSDEPRRKLRKVSKLRSVGELRSGLRRSRRATRAHINYRQYVMSESEPESTKAEKSDASYRCSDAEASENGEVSMEEDLDSDSNNNGNHSENVSAINPALEKSSSSDQDEADSVKGRRFLDLNELAPGSGFEDDPSTKDEDVTDD